MQVTPQLGLNPRANARMSRRLGKALTPASGACYEAAPSVCEAMGLARGERFPIGASSSGKTQGFGPCILGSNPSAPASAGTDRRRRFVVVTSRVLDGPQR